MRNSSSQGQAQGQDTNQDKTQGAFDTSRSSGAQQDSA